MQSIPDELQSLVYWATKLLGETIKEQFGKESFDAIEKTRREMKRIRSSGRKESVSSLLKTQKRIQGMSDERLKELAHSFSLMLELINRCESAYRHTRLQGREKRSYERRPHGVIFVFTAHPTEARSPEILELFQEVYRLLILALTKGKDHAQDRLKFYLGLSLNTSMARSSRPTVADEAHYLYSYVLRDEIISQQIQFAKEGSHVSFRSWVGGDKDGHPGVDERAMLASLNLSREKLLDWTEVRLGRIKSDLKFLSNVQSQIKLCDELKSLMKGLRKIRPGDGKKVVAFKKKAKELSSSLEKTRIGFPDMRDLSMLLWLYPAIVLPLEVREDAEVVEEALKNEDLAIFKMLKTIKEISEGYKPKWYARGFILSMSEQASDIMNGLELQKKTIGPYRIPVVPLFETAQALENSVQILEEYFQKRPAIKADHIKSMNGRFEVMLGYSDSSKESGVFPSRFLISSALNKMDAYFKKEKLTPVFFHGSGGSVERGGGSVREQTEWWPKSALNIFKATTQGEMVARNFQSDMIMESQVEKIIEVLNYKGRKNRARSKVADKFCREIQKRYQGLLGEEHFREDILDSTPYQYLDALKIGSRPSKRQTPGARLRAIPWVLCWTQTRVLMPTWWGVGSSFEALSAKEKDELKALFQKDNLISSYFKALGFTLRKVELSIFEMYLRQSHGRDRALEIVERFEEEYEKALRCFHWVTGQSELLWFRPWLSQSVYYRSSMIHPLNLAQLEALKRSDSELLRETVTGVACGMMTTG